MTAQHLLTLDEVADELATSWAQIYAPVRRGDLRAGQVGGRKQWRVSREELEVYIARMCKETEQFLKDHPFPGGGDAET